MRCCYLGVSCPRCLAWDAAIITKGSCPAERTRPAARSKKAPSVGWVPLPTSYSNRVPQSHTHRHTCLIGYLQPWVGLDKQPYSQRTLYI